MDPIMEAVELAAVKGALLRQAPPPLTIGRVEVGGILGRGGAGIVLDAHDPQLERRVAVKVLTSVGPAENRRLLREAQALARVSHPRVVEVLDVGIYEGRAYLSMAFVSGVGLRVWLARRARPLPERLRLIKEIADGLQAVHDVGLAHGDVKPENIIVDEHDHAVIVDFGLSGSGGSGETEAGGTPGFQAPEVALERPADPRSDQFSLCAMARLFIDDGGARLDRVWARGCRAEPSARFASMHELRRAIDRAVRLRRSWVWGAAALPVLVYAAWPSPRPACPPAEALLTASRTDTVRAALERGGANTDNLLHVQRRLAAFSDQWVQQTAKVCERSRAHGASVASDASRACLASSEREFAAVVAILSESSTEPISAAAAVRAIAGLRPLKRCVDAEPVPTPAALDDMLIRAGTLAKFGRLDAALELAQHAERRASAEASAPVRARATAEVGFALSAANRWQEAESTLERAYHLARQYRRDALAAECATALVDIVGIRLEREVDGRRWLGSARALLPLLDPDKRARYRLITQTYAALLAINAGEVSRGIELLEALLPGLDPAQTGDPLEGFGVVQALGIAYARASRWNEAEALFRRSYETVIAEIGPSVFAADELYNLGMLQRDSGRHAAAQTTLEEARALYVQTGGPDHVGVSDTDELLAEISGGSL